ncbi:phosphonatase-like hydrolase [Pseudonocardia ailaonensis]|uniref:Phosphonatase-like hydrolase n=1 Tax=Pseudonocardia ailaonensis TaxID=367279 RepID=A0ABN2N5X4_9PSEU
MDFALAVLDMAGTTVADDGLVVRAFTAALDDLRVGDAERPRMQQYVLDTMGRSKIEVFRALFAAESDAQRANAAFAAAYDELVGSVVPIPGAEDAIRALQEGGTRVALTTGFGAGTRDALLDALGWADLADLTLCPAEAGRGRPHPDLVLTAVLRLEIDDVRTVAVAGDTTSDVLTGLRAGATVSAGVLTGAHDAAALTAAGATHVLDSIADLPGLLGHR